MRYKQIGDRTLVAHYYNDKGYDLLRIARERNEPPPWSEAGRFFETATRIDPSLGRAWNNLGVAQARLGDLRAAELSYQRANKSPGNYLKTATEKNRVSLDFRRQTPGLEVSAWEKGEKPF
jgi:tetratricopeptide (TPR) repeat protein